MKDETARPPRRSARPSLAEITDTTPLRLADAVHVAFPMGGITGSGLRREAARGRLAIIRIAGKDWTTLADIKEMMEKCRVRPKEPISGCDPLGETNPVPSRAPDGSSKIEACKLAQAAAMETANRLKESLQNASRQNMRRRGANVVSRKSRWTT